MAGVNSQAASLSENVEKQRNQLATMLKLLILDFL